MDKMLSLLTWDFQKNKAKSCATIHFEEIELTSLEAPFQEFLSMLNANVEEENVVHVDQSVLLVKEFHLKVTRQHFKSDFDSKPFNAREDKGWKG